ncbi:MAG: membrane protein insertion efficiency factor YidD [Bacilli bacterium]
MKKVLLKIIRIYQSIPGNFHYNCRFTPTCSEYAYQAIKEYGSIKGSYLSIKRIIRCNPFGKVGYDPVEKRRRKK